MNHSNPVKKQTLPSFLILICTFKLPNELTSQILSFLPLREIFFNVQYVDKLWHSLSTRELKTRMLVDHFTNKYAQPLTSIPWEYIPLKQVVILARNLLRIKCHNREEKKLFDFTPPGEKKEPTDPSIWKHSPPGVPSYDKENKNWHEDYTRSTEEGYQIGVEYPVVHLCYSDKMEKDGVRVKFEVTWLSQSITSGGCKSFRFAKDQKSGFMFSIVKDHGNCLF